MDFVSMMTPVCLWSGTHLLAESATACVSSTFGRMFV